MQPAERLKGITPFVYAAEAGSFALAAERLNVTSSAVSKSVARLEARLGVTLFARTTRRLALTDAGRAYYETCTRVLMDLADAEAVLTAQKLDPAGRLRIDLPATFGRLRVMPVLLRFCAQYPNLRPHVTFTDRFVDLIEESIDVAVRIGGGRDWPASVAHRELSRERLIFCAAPSYLAKRGTPQDVADLADHDCVVYVRPDGSIGPWSFAAAGGIIERRAVPHRFVANDAEAQLAAVLNGLGVAQLATWLAEDGLRSSQLVEVLAGFSTDGLPLQVIWPRARQLTPKIDALLQMFDAELRID
jgi:DNA-binding transcriptional LysR family regulator